jgi:hypothetical protein
MPGGIFAAILGSRAKSGPAGAFGFDTHAGRKVRAIFRHFARIASEEEQEYGSSQEMCNDSIDGH